MVPSWLQGQQVLMYADHLTELRALWFLASHKLAEELKYRRLGRIWEGCQAGMHQWDDYEAGVRAHPKYQLKPYS